MGEYRNRCEPSSCCAWAGRYCADSLLVLGGREYFCWLKGSASVSMSISLPLYSMFALRVRSGRAVLPGAEVVEGDCNESVCNGVDSCVLWFWFWFWL